MIKYLLILIILSSNAFALIFPIFSYSESSGANYGGFSQLKLDEEKDTNLLLYLISGQRGQSGFINATNLQFKNNPLNVFLYGSNSARSYNGIANYNSIDITSLYYDQINFRVTTEQSFYKNWTMILGINYRYYNENNSKNNNSNSIFNSLNDFGGIIGFQLDKRNKEINTESGYFNEIKAFVFDNYQIVSNDIRFFTPVQNGILALKIYGAQTFTNIPHFSYYQRAGNYFYLRGFSTNQVLDKNLIYSQLEWRKELFNWPILSPFLELGAMGNSPFSLKQSYISYGLGLYLPIGNGRLRIEKGYSYNNDKFYFGFNHVF